MTFSASSSVGGAEDRVELSESLMIGERTKDENACGKKENKEEVCGWQNWRSELNYSDLRSTWHHRLGGVRLSRRPV